MTWLIRPNLWYNACCYIDAPLELNPGLGKSGMPHALHGPYERRNEPLGLVHNTPKILQTEKIKSPGDFFGPAGSPSAVSQRFKDLIEKFEPGVHEFFPIKLVNGRRTEWPGNYYLMRVRTWRSALMINQSRVYWSERSDGSFYLSPHPWTKGEIYINSRQVENSHLWRNVPCLGNKLFCSDEFYKACRAAKLKYLKWRKCVDVDEPWDPYGNLGPVEGSDIR